MVGDGVRQDLLEAVSDGRPVPVLKTWAPANVNHEVAVIAHHGGPGATPIGDPLSPLAVDLARAGFPVFALLSRHSAGFATAGFDTLLKDLDATVGFARTHGHTKFVLLGHSMGSVTIANYVRVRRPEDVLALIHLAPTADLPAWVERSLGTKEYRRVVGAAEASVAAGRGEIDLVDVTMQPCAPAPAGSPTRHVQTASTWLSWYGPNADAVNSEIFPELQLPMLLACGDADDYNTRNRVDHLVNIAGSDDVELRWYDGGVGHFFTEALGRLACDVVDWLLRIVAPLPSVDVCIVRMEVNASRGAAFRYTLRDAEAVGPPCLVLADPDGEPYGRRLHQLATAMAGDGITTYVPVSHPTGYLSMYRLERDQRSRVVAAWVTQIESERGSLPVVLGLGRLPLQVSKEIVEAEVGRELRWLSLGFCDSGSSEPVGRSLISVGDGEPLVLTPRASSSTLATAYRPSPDLDVVPILRSDSSQCVLAKGAAWQPLDVDWATPKDGEMSPDDVAALRNALSAPARSVHQGRLR